MHKYLVAQLLFAQDTRHKLTAHILNIKRYSAISKMFKSFDQSSTFNHSIEFYDEPMLLTQISIRFAGLPGRGCTSCFRLQEMCKADAYWRTPGGGLRSGSRIQDLDPDAPPWLDTVDSTMLAWRKLAQWRTPFCAKSQERRHHVTEFR